LIQMKLMKEKMEVDEEKKRRRVRKMYFLF